MTNNTFLVTGRKSWNERVFKDQIAHYPGQWHFIGNPELLTMDYLQEIQPSRIFFLHWSKKVPESIIEKFECINFHMTDLPYGRGGSPLQNLIVRGHRTTTITAHRMVEDFDAGPVYLKRSMSLEGSTAEEIYIRSSYISAEMILEIIEQNIEPSMQEGEAVVFKRRRPSQSRLPDDMTIQQLYDFIRMLDADGYPHAFLEYEGFRFEFSRAGYYDNRIEASVTITPVEKES
jgi:methionyl-tRNA formyltransferase